jgi:hypothetical protein
MYLLLFCKMMKVISLSEFYISCSSFLLQACWKWLLIVDQMYFFSFGHRTSCWKKKLVWCNNWTFCCRPQSTRRVVVGIKVLLLFLHNHSYQISSFSLCSSLFLFILRNWIHFNWFYSLLYNRYLNSNKILYF